VANGIQFNTQQVRLLKAAADKWVLDTGIAWDIAAMWNLPNGDIPGGVDHIEIEVGRRLRRYFNLLDRRVFKSKHKRGHRLQRFITIEHAHSVGWHVHGIQVKARLVRHNSKSLSTIHHEAVIWVTAQRSWNNRPYEYQLQLIPLN
jgi:hypothetical protein